MRNLVLAATLAITTTLPAFAEESCQLKRLAVIPFQTDRTAHVYVPVTLNGRMTHLMLDTGAFWSGLNNGLVKALNLTPQTSTFVYMYDLAGEKIDKMVTVSEMKIGEVPFTEPVDFFVHGEAGGSIEEDGGVLGRNLFTQMDVEIDNAGKTISLFTQDHCKGAGVYWADEAVTLTFKKQTTPPPVGTHLRQKTPKNQIDTPIVGADLEGEEVSVLFDTGATKTVIDMDHAKRRFGLTPTSPGVTPAGKVYTASGATVDTYAYTFKSLSISGVRFENVPVLLGDFDNSAQVILGMHELKHLHLYFAFKDGMIHITAADAGKLQQ